MNLRTVVPATLVAMAIGFSGSATLSAKRIQQAAELAAAAPAAQTAAVDEAPVPLPPYSPFTEKKLLVRRGDTLGEVMSRANLSGDDHTRVMAALTRVFNPYDLKPGQTINLTFDKDRLAGLDMTPDAQRSLTVTRDDAGNFVAREIKSPLTTVTRIAGGSIDGSLYEAAIKAKLPPQILSAFIRYYSYNVDFQRDLQPGDTFQVLYQLTVNDKGEMVRPGNILAASLDVDGEPQKIYLNQTGEGGLDYFSPDGRSIRKTLLRTPVDGAKITSGFGMRMHPLLGYTRMHKGVDFGAPAGTPVYAAGDGIVEKMGWYGGYGKYVRLRHSSEMGTAYAHLSRFNPDLHEGSRVRQGEVIAYTGATGEATGPHLHYEVLKDGTQVNPLTVTAPLGNVLAGRDLVAFHKVMDDRDRQIRELIHPTEVATRTVPSVAKVE
jgi:murein DD-endopeptidase MepM/ murein hydrolase activator NlpD